MSEIKDIKEIIETKETQDPQVGQVGVAIDDCFNLDKNKDNHYTFLPIYNHKYYEYYKKQLSTFWTVEEVDLSKDREQFNTKLSETERTFVKNILAFFAASDGIVAENLDMNFIEEITYKEVRTCLRFQAMMEDIHSEMYSRLIDTLISDEKEKDHIFNAITTIPCIKLKAEWAKKWTCAETATLPHRLIAFACVEGIHFSGSFCAIYWLKKRNLMPGLTLSNEFIARDEGCHTETCISLYNDLKTEMRLDEKVVKTIIEEAVDIESVFITDSISCSMLGMNVDMMKQYIKFVGDRLLLQLGYDKIYNVANPFDFMENISVENKTNFFEDRVSNYSKAGVCGKEEDKEFDLEADF
jgi:ribonucleotide reductase beta subunit family protein with ferritin-like domain